MPGTHRNLHSLRDRRARDNAERAVDVEAIARDLGRRQLAMDTGLPGTIEAPITKTAGTNTVLVEATGGPSPSATLIDAGQDTLDASPTANSNGQGGQTSSASSSDSDGEGVNVATIAGIVFGVLGGVLIIAGIAYFLFARRRKQQARPRRVDEKKSGEPKTEMSLAPTSQRPPRLSLRPITQLFGWGNEKPLHKTGASSLSPESAANARHAPNAFERPSTSQSMHPNNPFGNQAERVPTPIMEEHSMEERRVDRSLPPTPSADAAASRDPFATPAAGLTRKTSMRKDGPRHLDLTLSKPLAIVPASPAITEFSLKLGGPTSPEPAYESQGAAAIAAAGGPANTPVHRVQLDFKPTLEDEMDLKAGDLIRLLHEYDDGWALCIRLDRSRQGVVPRTCLSTRPVKPRNAPGPRPMTPQGRPMTPQGRPESPSRPRTANGAASPRPLSPGGRSMSPGPRYQGSPDHRPRSPSGLSRPANGAGPGPSPMNPFASQTRAEQGLPRLPGQAM